MLQQEGWRPHGRGGGAGPPPAHIQTPGKEPPTPPRRYAEIIAAHAGRDVEQVMRDAKIASIYEGTNGIQAIDLATRKVKLAGGAPMAGLYAMSKAGILALTKSAAQEYAKNRIRVNALVAGGFDTDLLRGTVSRMLEGDEEKIRATFEGFAARIPLGRIGEPKEAAEAAVWLCSDAASYVTGHSMIVDGGLTSWAR